MRRILVTGTGPDRDAQDERLRQDATLPLADVVDRLVEIGTAS